MAENVAGLAHRMEAERINTTTKLATSALRKIQKTIEKKKKKITSALTGGASAAAGELTGKL